VPIGKSIGCWHDIPAAERDTEVASCQRNEIYGRLMARGFAGATGWRRSRTRLPLVGRDVDGSHHGRCGARRMFARATGSRSPLTYRPPPPPAACRNTFRVADGFARTRTGRYLPRQSLRPRGFQQTGWISASTPALGHRFLQMPAAVEGSTSGGRGGAGTQGRG
jgi:hypothetical protein